MQAQVLESMDEMEDFVPNSTIDLDTSRIARAAESREEVYNFKKGTKVKSRTPRSDL